MRFSEWHLPKKWIGWMGTAFGSIVGAMLAIYLVLSISGFVQDLLGSFFESSPEIEIGMIELGITLLLLFIYIVIIRWL